MSFHLQHAPVLALKDGETVQVEEKHDGEIVFYPWERVPDFSRSDRFDRHFTLDESSGLVCFGPSVRQPDGSVRQYGRVPESGRKLRISQYRYGGGVAGNVPAEKVEMMRSAVPYVDRVVNFGRAEGGRDQETLDEVKQRARREMRAQQRAVTADDFENLGRAATRSVARVKCVSAGRDIRGGQPGVIRLMVVPAAFDSIKAGDLAKLELKPALQKQVRDYLDKYRLLTTIIEVCQPNYLGVKVSAHIVVSPFVQPEVVRARVLQRLQEFLSPLAIGGQDPQDELFGPAWEGWPFGRDLYLSELYALIQQTPGVKHVSEVAISTRKIDPAQEAAAAEGSGPAVSIELSPLTEKMLQVPADTLLCSLEQEIEVVEL